ncbi:TonB-dependent receptor [Kordiimonas sp.]|uniref:TonB-dependent receptor n=1 Tax=Kordiimonas sp. TaxID=1970157 RepID=UPI003A907FD6
MTIKKYDAWSPMLAVFSSSLSLIVATQSANAQDTTQAAEADATIETVVVTARRRGESMLNVPIAMSTRSGEQLDLSGATDITALQRTTPNLTLQVSRGTNSTLTTFVRGIGQQDPLWGFEPGVGLYVDDVYIARPQGAILDILDVERIEVLRGPQGTLYGRNTIGGAVKYVTAKIKAEPTFRARANVGTYGQRDFIFAGSTPVTETLHVGGAVGLYKRDGYGENHFSGAETNDKDAWAGRLSVEFSPTPDLFFRASADRTEDTSNANHGHRELPVPEAYALPPITDPYGIDVPLSAFPVTENVYDTWAGLGDYNKVITEGVSFLAEWSVSESLTLKSISAYRDGVTITEGIDFDGTPAPVLDIAAPETVYDDDQFSQEFQASFSFSGMRGLAGVYYLDASASGGYDTIIGLGASAIPGTPTPNLTQGTSGTVDTKSYAAFADVDIDLTERLSVSLGLRWTRDEKTGVVFKANYLGLGSPLSGENGVQIQLLTDYTNSVAFEELTPRASVSYALSPSMNIYAAYSRGFKSGGFDMRGDAVATPETINGYDPETVDSYELGLKGTFFDGRLTMASALFHAAYNGQQVTSQQLNATGSGLVSFIDNVGSSKIKGAEIEGTARFTEALSADFGVGYIDAGFDEYLAYRADPAVPTAYILTDVADSRQFQNTPKWNGNLSLNYRYDLGTKGDLNIRGGVSFRSMSSMFETPVSEIDQKAYQLYDISVVWTSARADWRIGVHGRNLGNEKYRTGGYYFPGLAYGDSIIGFYAPPRTVTVSLEYRF